MSRCRQIAHGLAAKIHKARRVTASRWIKAPSLPAHVALRAGNLLLQGRSMRRRREEEKKEEEDLFTKVVRKIRSRAYVHTFAEQR